MKPSHWNDIGQDSQDMFAVDAKWIAAKFAGAVRKDVHEFQSLKGEKRNGGINQKEKKEQERRNKMIYIYPKYDYTRGINIISFICQWNTAIPQ